MRPSAAIKTEICRIPPSMSLIISIVLWFAIFRDGSHGCERGNAQMNACLHRYLERDFAIVEELVRRPPYGENGHVLIEETELESMCARFADMTECYARMARGCVSYVQYRHMKRILTALRTVEHSFCSPKSFLIKDLIQGGYCLEVVRHESPCSPSASQSLSWNDLNESSARKNDSFVTMQNFTPSDDNDNADRRRRLPVLHFDFDTIRTTADRYRWPYTLNSMLRFESGRNICAYLREYRRCLRPYIEQRCREDSRSVWNASIEAIATIWCDDVREGEERQDPRSTAASIHQSLIVIFFCLHYALILASPSLIIF